MRLPGLYRHTGNCKFCEIGKSHGLLIFSNTCFWNSLREWKGCVSNVVFEIEKCAIWNDVRSESNRNFGERMKVLSSLIWLSKYHEYRKNRCVSVSCIGFFVSFDQSTFLLRIRSALWFFYVFLRDCSFETALSSRSAYFPCQESVCFWYREMALRTACLSRLHRGARSFLESPSPVSRSITIDSGRKASWAAVIWAYSAKESGATPPCRQSCSRSVPLRICSRWIFTASGRNCPRMRAVSSISWSDSPGRPLIRWTQMRMFRLRSFSIACKKTENG